MHDAMIFRNGWRVNGAAWPQLEVSTMQIEINRSTLSLARDGLVAIRDGQGTRVVCHAGSLWITQECDVKDAVITDGESFTVNHPGLTLVTGLSASELTIVEPRAATQSQPWQRARRNKLQPEPALCA